MSRDEWDALFESLKRTREIVVGWTPIDPEPDKLRCEHSRHRTLAHLRACQEQWLPVVEALRSRESPSLTVLHPWRKFDQGEYATISWEDHLRRYLDDRSRWLAWQHSVDWTRGGKLNRQPTTIGKLTKRVADHEAYHVGLFQ